MQFPAFPPIGWIFIEMLNISHIPTRVQKVGIPAKSHVQVHNVYLDFSFLKPLNTYIHPFAFQTRAYPLFIWNTYKYIGEQKTSSDVQI